MHLRLRETRKFHLSGFGESERDQLVRYVLDLKAQYLESRDYLAECTHIVSQRPMRSEKYLCGCAAGKWVLVKDYIVKSHKVGRWLEECDYEWGSPATKHLSYSLGMNSPRRWREYVERTGKRAFSDWTVGLIIENIERRPNVYKRLLQTGGAKVVSMSTANTADLTHILVDKAYRSKIKTFAMKGVICVVPDFLAEVLFEESPNVSKYHVLSVNVTLSPVVSISDMIGSQCPSSLTNSTCSSASVVVSASSSKSICDPFTRAMHGCAAKNSVGSSTKRMSASSTTNSGSLTRFAIASCTKVAHDLSATKITGFQTITSRSAGTRSRSVRQLSNDSKNMIAHSKLSRKTALSDIGKQKEMRSPTRYLNSTPEKKAVAIKRKLVFTESEVKEALKHVKRQKLETPTYSVNPYMMQALPKQGSQLTCAAPFYNLTSNIIEGAIEEGLWEEAVHMAKTETSTFRYPPPRVLHTFMQEMLVTESSPLARDLFSVLTRCQCLHPPSGMHLPINIMYLQSFCTEGVMKSNEKSSELYFCCDTPWDFMNYVICGAISAGQESKAVERGQCLLLLHYLVALFEQDFKAFCDRWRNKDKMRQGVEETMVAKVLWPRGPVKPTVPFVRKLMDYLVQALDMVTVDKGSESQACYGQASDEKSSWKCLRLLQALFGMAAECCRIAESKEPNAVLTGISEEGLGSDLVREMVSRLKQSGMLINQKCVELFLDTLTCSWVKTMSLVTILSTYDSALVANSNSKMKDQKLSLGKIVTWYFYLLPESTSRINAVRAPTKTPDVPKVQIKSERPLKVNKRNAKETSWTGLNLLAAPSCGTTPLHDAVINGRIEIARLLVQSKGKKLLSAMNVDGYTPLDYAVTTEMKAALLSFDKENNVEESPSMSSVDKVHNSSMPDDQTYREVLGQPPVLVDSTKCAIFATLIQHLLMDYIIRNDLQILRQEVDCAQSRIHNVKVRPLSSNGQTSQPGSDIRAILPECVKQSNEERVLCDLTVFSQLNDHLSNFHKHLSKISIGTSASILLRLQMLGGFVDNSADL
ncbi:SMC5-SMC6 complex localization factor protein 1-like isoform X2 [Anneissia japonica]|uniref:SMC5-SMC6 complex localization factor protein 1-like isoform X2 n=1 Tax=Anneissia japonica TaxID=1529436 RepID=UPI001425573D|nr:SMC5-SMC6 complex localization factor protein 1-like isoform X2 [Anneissia japonica]